MIVSLARTDYLDASYAHLSELLARDHQVVVSPKTVGRVLKQAGLAHAHSHRGPRKHRTRPRMTQEGVMALMDASPFDWLETRGPRLNLHGAIDDATGKVVGLYFASQECTDGYLRVLWQIATQHGLPARIYTDRHTLFFSPRQLTPEEEVAGDKAELTQFGLVLADLGVRHIKARSPQAKGRVERLWGTLQERLTLEMRIEGVSTMEEANRFLPSFIAAHNQRFAVEAANPNAAWRKAPPNNQLAFTIAIRHRRIASRGSTISFEAKLWQLIREDGKPLPLPHQAVVVVTLMLDGHIRALYNAKSYPMALCDQPKQIKTVPEPKPVLKDNPANARKPAADHPWKRNMVTNKQRGDIISVPFHARKG